MRVMAHQPQVFPALYRLHRFLSADVYVCADLCTMSKGQWHQRFQVKGSDGLVRAYSFPVSSHSERYCDLRVTSFKAGRPANKDLMARIEGQLSKYPYWSELKTYLDVVFAWEEETPKYTYVVRKQMEALWAFLPVDIAQTYPKWVWESDLGEPPELAAGGRPADRTLFLVTSVGGTMLYTGGADSLTARYLDKSAFEAAGVRVVHQQFGPDDDEMSGRSFIEAWARLGMNGMCEMLKTLAKDDLPRKDWRC